MKFNLNCTCGAMWVDYVEGSSNGPTECDCDAIFRILAALVHAEGLSTLAGAVTPTISRGLVDVVSDILANHREA